MDPGIAALIGALIATIGSVVVALIQARSTQPDDSPKIVVPSGAIVSRSRPITWRTIAWIIVFALVGGMVGYLLGRVGLVPSTPTPTSSVVMSRMIAIQTHHKQDSKNRYVTAMGSDRDWVLRGETIELKEFEKFTMLCLDNTKVAFQTYHTNEEGDKHRYVTVMGTDDEWRLRGSAPELTECAEFALYDAVTEGQLLCLDVFDLLEQGEVNIALQTCRRNDQGDKNKYVTAMNDEDDRDWELRAQTDELKDWERFTLIPLP